MSKYRFGRAVGSDLEAVWEFIAADDVEAADRWVERLFAVFEKLARNPGMGHRRRELTLDNVLFWPVGAYLVIYRVVSGVVEIVAVTQGSRDVPRFLSQRMLADDRRADGE